MSNDKPKCDVAFCRRPATHVISWPSDAGGECEAYRCARCVRTLSGTATHRLIATAATGEAGSHEQQ